MFRKHRGATSAVFEASALDVREDAVAALELAGGAPGCKHLGLRSQPARALAYAVVEVSLRDQQTRVRLVSDECIARSAVAQRTMATRQAPAAALRA